MADTQRIDDLRRRVQKDPASIAFAQLAEECRRAEQYEESVEVCRAGLAIHPGSEASFPAGDNIASVWDTPQDPSAGRIATGIVALPEENPKTLKTADNILMIFERKPGETFTYYAGSGWSKADMKSQADWNRYLTSFLEFRKNPITSQWTKK